MDLLSIILAVIAVVLTSGLLYVLYISRNHRLFAKQGLPCIKPIPGLGSVHEIGKIGFIGFHEKYYSKFKDQKVYGYFESSLPVLVVRDLDMMQDIMVKNFNCFVDRRIFTDEQPIRSSLNNLEGDHWRHVRNTVSPTFTTGKLKKLCTHVQSNARQLRDNLKSNCGIDQDLKEMMSCFAMDVIASTGFGVNTDSLNDKSSPFSEEAKSMLNISNVKVAFAIFVPWLFKILNKFGVGFFPKKSVNFFTSFVDAALENRVQSEDDGKNRTDFIQLVVEEGRKKEGGKKGLSYSEFQGQAFIFIFAGYDTVSTTLSFFFFLLAHNPFATKKIQEEIDEILKGEFPSYESAQTMTYLDMCLNEVIRLYPPGFVIDRVCTYDCTIQGIDIKKGTTVLFPFMEIFRDPTHFPDPLKFDPERHSVENKEKRHPFAFLPFGQGPRNCIGMRLALLEMKVAIVAILQVMTPVPCEKSVYPPRLNKFQLKAEDGLWVKFVEREDKQLR